MITTFACVVDDIIYKILYLIDINSVINFCSCCKKYYKLDMQRLWVGLYKRDMPDIVLYAVSDNWKELYKQIYLCIREHPSTQRYMNEYFELGSRDVNYLMQQCVFKCRNVAVKYLINSKPIVFNDNVFGKIIMTDNVEGLKIILADNRVSCDMINAAVVCLTDIKILPCEVGNQNMVNKISKRTEMLKLLLNDKRLDLSKASGKPVINASRSGCYEMVELLLKQSGIDPSVQCNEPITIAAENGHIRVVEFLMKDKRVSVNDNHNITIRVAADYGYYDVVELLLNTSDKSTEDRLKVDPSDTPQIGEPLIAILCRKRKGNENINLIKRVLSYPGVDPSIKNNLPLLGAILYDNIDIFRLLINYDKVQAYINDYDNHPILTMSYGKEKSEICYFKSALIADSFETFVGLLEFENYKHSLTLERLYELIEFAIKWERDHEDIQVFRSVGENRFPIMIDRYRYIKKLLTSKYDNLTLDPYAKVLRDESIYSICIKLGKFEIASVIETYYPKTIYPIDCIDIIKLDPMANCREPYTIVEMTNILQRFGVKIEGRRDNLLQTLLSYIGPIDTSNNSVVIPDYVDIKKLDLSLGRNSYKVDELRTICKKLGLICGGTKSFLTDRIKIYFQLKTSNRKISQKNE